MKAVHDKTIRVGDRKKIYDFLKSHPIASLGTVGEECRPHITIVYISADKDFNVTFTTKRQTAKHRNITRNPHVTLLVYEAFSQTCIQVTGTAEEIWDVNEAGEVFRRTLNSSLKTSGIGIPPVAKMYGDYVAYKIVPEQISMTVFSRANPSNYQLYDSVHNETTIK